jgi:hemerythrin
VCSRLFILWRRNGSVEFYSWSDDLEIGEETIDTQHKWLFDTYNYLMSTYKDQPGTDWLITSITHLYEYTENHFNYEESIQIRCGFPDYEKHKQLHEAFKQKALDFVARLKAEGPTDDLGMQLNATIGVWLARHVKTEDSKMAAYIKR